MLCIVCLVREFVRWIPVAVFLIVRAERLSVKGARNSVRTAEVIACVRMEANTTVVLLDVLSSAAAITPSAVLR